MNYNYEAQKPDLLTDVGQRMFLKFRDNVNEILKIAGAVRMAEAMNCRGVSGDSWFLLACMDRMVELGEVRELTSGDCAGQHRVFISAR